MALEKSSRKEGLKQLTSTLLWDLRNDKKLTPALDQRVDRLEQKLLAKYCTQEAGWYSDNLQYKQAFQGLAREVVDARKCMREEEQEDRAAVVEEGTRDTMSLDEHDLSPNLEQVEAWEEPIDTQIDALRQGLLHLTDPASLQDSRAGKPPHDTVSSDAHDFPPDLEELEPEEKCPLLFEPHLADVLSQRVFGKAMSGHQQLLEASRHGDAEKVFISSSFLPVFLHMPIPIYATRQASHFLRSPHLLISCSFVTRKSQ